jgi:hypothetical protein
MICALLNPSTTSKLVPKQSRSTWPCHHLNCFFFFWPKVPKALPQGYDGAFRATSNPSYGLAGAVKGKNTCARPPYYISLLMLLCCYNHHVLFPITSVARLFCLVPLATLVTVATIRCFATLQQPHHDPQISPQPRPSDGCNRYALFLLRTGTPHHLDALLPFCLSYRNQEGAK